MTTYFFKTKTDQAKTKTTFSRPRSLFFLKTIKWLTQDLKKCSLNRKKTRLVIPVLTSHARIMPVTEKKKKMLITGFLVKFCFI